ncbi:MAG: hypothetical protein ACOX0F_13775 [Syntrophomonadaceae bacterium]
MSVKITDHICERYAERILGIPPANIPKYVAENRPLVAQEIQDLVQNAILVYRGQIGQAQSPASYYVCGDIILILSFESKKAITLYRPDFGYPGAVNRKMVRALTQEIHKNQRRLKEITPGVEKRINCRKERVKAIDAQLAKYRKRIEKLEVEKKKANRQIWAQNSRSEDINQEIVTLATKLVRGGKELCYMAGKGMKNTKV